MNTLQLRTLYILLMVGLGANTAWSGQKVPTTALMESRANVPTVAKAESEKNSGAASEGLPSIMKEEDIPAFLRTDPCDTGDS